MVRCGKRRCPAGILPASEQNQALPRVPVQPSNLSHFRSTAQIELGMEIAVPSSRLPPCYSSHDKDGCCHSGRHLRAAESGRALPWFVPHLNQAVECIGVLHSPPLAPLSLQRPKCSFRPSQVYPNRLPHLFGGALPSTLTSVSGVRVLRRCSLDSLLPRGKSRARVQS